MTVEKLPRAYYTGSVDVGNESCPQSLFLLRDRHIVHMHSRRRHSVWSFYTVVRVKTSSCYVFVQQQCVATCQAETPTTRYDMTNCRYTPRAYYTGDVDVGNESCPQSLLRDRQLKGSLIVGTQSGRYMQCLFVAKLEVAMFFQQQQQCTATGHAETPTARWHD